VRREVPFSRHEPKGPATRHASRTFRLRAGPSHGRPALIASTEKRSTAAGIPDGRNRSAQL
jgi:hypothetical protein